MKQNLRNHGGVRRGRRRIKSIVKIFDGLSGILSRGERGWGRKDEERESEELIELRKPKFTISKNFGGMLGS